MPTIARSGKFGTEGGHGVQSGTAKRAALANVINTGTLTPHIWHTLHHQYVIYFAYKKLARGLH